MLMIGTPCQVPIFKGNREHCWWTKQCHGGTCSPCSASAQEIILCSFQTRMNGVLQWNTLKKASYFIFHPKRKLNHNRKVSHHQPEVQSKIRSQDLLLLISEKNYIFTSCYSLRCKLDKCGRGGHFLVVSTQLDPKSRLLQGATHGEEETVFIVCHVLKCPWSQCRWSPWQLLAEEDF